MVLAILLAALAVVIALLVVAVQPGPAHAHLARVLG
jgi:hypothetical protein